MTVLLTASVTSWLSQARASAPVKVVCVSKFEPDWKLDKLASDTTARWMNDQAAAGRTNFVTAPTPDAKIQALCAW